MKQRQGFTLIELLVVIAIIAILAAILFPVFAQAREKARQTTCLSNEKQMGLAIMMYTQDSDEHFPQGQYFSLGGYNGTPMDWANAVSPYIKSGTASNQNGTQNVYNGQGGVFSCPSFPTTQVAEYGAHQYLMVPNPDPITGNVDTPPSLAQIDDVADKVMVAEKGQGADGGYPVFVADEYDWVGWLNDGSSTNFVLRDDAGDPAPAKDLAYDYDESIGGTAAPSETSPASYPRYRHTTHTNLLFCDGHAKAMAKGAISGKYWLKYIWIPGVTPSTDVPDSYTPSF